MKTREAQTLVNAGDFAKCRAWTAQSLTDAAHLPISFVVDGEQIQGIPAAWRPTTMTRRLDAKPFGNGL